MRTGLRIAALIGVLAAAATAACSRPPPEQLKLDRNQLTVYNTTDTEWQNVELWLNHYFRATVGSIPPRGSFLVRLDQFVDSYGRRFDYGGLQITDVRLKAKRPDGQPVEVVMPFKKDALTDALGGRK